METLDQVKTNETVKINQITDPELFEVVSSFGFVEGSQVTVISKLPGALTCEFKRSRFAIRAEDAASIVVEQ